MNNIEAITLYIQTTKKCLQMSLEKNMNDIEYLKGRLQGLEDCLSTITENNNPGLMFP